MLTKYNHMFFSYLKKINLHKLETLRVKNFDEYSAIKRTHYVPEYTLLAIYI